jgi:hypothetical protein
VRILVEVVDAVGVEQRAAALDAVHLVALVEQELGEVGAVLAGDAGDEMRWPMALSQTDARSMKMPLFQKCRPPAT